VLSHCWLGHLTLKKPVPDMTYNVFGGTLSIAQSINQSINSKDVILFFSAVISVATFTTIQCNRPHHALRLYCFFVTICLATERLAITTNRSSNVATCEVPRTCTSMGNQSFTVAGPRLWNNLPLHLRDSEHTFLEFGGLLKTYLFC